MCWGRERELGRLRDELNAVVQSGQGRMLALRGRRQSGKSRLLAEFVERAGVPYLFSTAVKTAPSDVQLQMVVTALSPAEVAAAVGDRDPVDVIDVYLATGGDPRLVPAAAEHLDAATFVHAQLSDDTSPLMVTGQRILSSEFRHAESPRAVLEAIGSVEVGHAPGQAAGNHRHAGGCRAEVQAAPLPDQGSEPAVLLAIPSAGARPRRTGPS